MSNPFLDSFYYDNQAKTLHSQSQHRKAETSFARALQREKLIMLESTVIGESFSISNPNFKRLVLNISMQFKFVPFGQIYMIAGVSLSYILANLMKLLKNSKKHQGLAQITLLCRQI